MAATVSGVLLYGVHGSRPSSGVATGTLYACSTHGLVYQTTDNGATWVTWATLSGRVLYEFVIDGGGSAISTGIKGDLYVPDAFTITGVVMLADQSGSIVVDIWNDTYANYPPTDADSLPGAGTPPTISSATKSKDTTLTSWDTSVPADSTLRFNVDSATTVTRVTVAIWGIRV